MHQQEPEYFDYPLMRLHHIYPQFFEIYLNYAVKIIRELMSEGGCNMSVIRSFYGRTAFEDVQDYFHEHQMFAFYRQALTGRVICKYFDKPGDVHGNHILRHISPSNHVGFIFFNCLQVSDLRHACQILNGEDEASRQVPALLQRLLDKLYAALYRNHVSE